MIKKKTKSNKYKFKLSDIMSIAADTRGVYGLWHGERCLYVGQAKDQDIGDRLLQHWSDCHNEILKAWIDVYGSDIEFCYISSDKIRIDVLEDTLIKKYQPVANKTGKGG